MPITDPYGAPASTYRLQLRKEFSFPDAGRIVPYLHELGVSHCYLSPLLMSAPGSTHGYDVNDYHRIDDELGGRRGFEEFAAVLRAHGLRTLLDFVPNHMGIQGTSNRWWQDVLECGPHSSYADFFDVDWREQEGSGRARVLVPILDQQYGRVLEAGRFSLRLNAVKGTLALHYEDLSFPLRPASYAEILTLTAAEPGRAEPVRATLLDLASGFDALRPDKDGVIPRAARDEMKQRLATELKASAELADAMTAQLTAINGKPDEPRSVDRLDALISDQHYRLAHWKTGVHEVNYRRFFAIDTLIGLHVEAPRVFDETHRLIAGLIRDQLAHGLRIDHIDGLRNPREYLERLQLHLRPGGAPPEAPLYTVVEKILADGEELDASWATHGTTGYEFIRQLADVLVDSTAELKFTRRYAEFTSRTETFEDVVYSTKRHVLEEMFANAVSWLGQQLSQLVSTDRCWRDLTRHEIVVAIREIMAAMGVYRTYRRMHVECRPEDAREVERAFQAAVRRNPNRDAQAFEFVRDLLIGRYPAADATLDYRVSLWRWVLTFQQYTGAIMAKSVEDTAFYVYNRFVALNEVGGEPGAFGGTVEKFHAANARRRETNPHSLLATSTHDTKFGEDARARLYVLSEIPGEWDDWVEEWRELARGFKTQVGSRLAPDANEEYRLYQTLLACWPPEMTEPDEVFRERIRNHVRKAVNEAKDNTHWLHPNDAWLEAGDRFVDALLTSDTGRAFLASFVPKARRLAHLGLTNTLAQVVLKITSPGVPDFYQGSELWNLSLVDPDNRSLLDWEGPRQLLAALAGRSWRDLLRDWKTGGVKLRLTQELLRLRQAKLALFQQGDYTPLTASGRFADRVVAFMRRFQGESIVVLVPRLTVTLGSPPLGLVWEDTTLVLPAAQTGWRDALTGTEWKSDQPVALAEWLTEMPVGVLLARN